MEQQTGLQIFVGISTLLWIVLTGASLAWVLFGGTEIGEESFFSRFVIWLVSNFIIILLWLIGFGVYFINTHLRWVW